MMDTHLRHKIQPTADYIVKILSRSKITANHLTLAALMTGILAAISVAKGMMALGLLCLWISGILDVLDGSLARIRGSATSFGAYMDLIFDRIVEMAIIFGFYFWHSDYTFVCMLFLAGAMFNFSTFMLAGQIFENKGVKSMHYDVGLLERTETFMCFSLVILFPSIGIWVLGIFDGLMVLTGCLRTMRIYRALRLNDMKNE